MAKQLPSRSTTDEKVTAFSVAKTTTQILTIHCLISTHLDILLVLLFVPAAYSWFALIPG